MDVTERNELAELAESMKRKVGDFSADESFKAALENADSPEEQKAAEFFREYALASRIVAELAKVEKPIDLRTVGMAHLADILEAEKNRAVEIVRNCRIIAMGGAGDGK